MVSDRTISASTLLVRALDAGGTYLSFRWLDDPDHPTVRRIPLTDIHTINELLDEALISGDGGAASDRDVVSALTGPLSSPVAEREFSTTLAEILLGPDVRAQIADRARRGEVSIGYTPSAATSRIPIDLLPVVDDVRLIEVSNLFCSPPVTLRAGRVVEPSRWTSPLSEQPVLYIIDPEVPGAAGLHQVLPPLISGIVSSTNAFASLLNRTPHTANSVLRRRITRWGMSRDLQARPSRLMYFGHVSSNVAQPGSASIHLSDDEYCWGLCTIHGGSHRPMSALDFVYGTRLPSMGPDDRDPPPRYRGLSGHVLWPMPPRVALITCEGGVDYRSKEIFGLVTACMNAGAELITTTRWPLPSDAALRHYGGVRSIPGPATALALAVDAAHRTTDPISSLNTWQRGQLARWRATGDLQYSPLMWAAVTDHTSAPGGSHGHARQAAS